MNESVTFIGFGALEIGKNWGLGKGEAVEGPEENEAETVLKTVLDLGINIIDTASAYHRSEERIGKAVSERKYDYILASKCGEHSREPGTYYDYSYQAIKSSIDQSLRLLKTDVIDLMQIHFGPDPEKVLDQGETVGAMKDAQREGKVRFLGASIDGQLATRCINSGDFDVMQLGYNLLHQGGAQNIELAASNGVGVLIRTGLGNGQLTSRVLTWIDQINGRERNIIQQLLALVENDADLLTAIALNFLHQNPHISSVLLGTKKGQHLRENFTMLERNIESSLLDRALKNCS